MIRVLALAFLLLAGVARATTFTVTSTADSGAGTLRDAINSVNGGAGGDTIAFGISGAGSHTITLSSALPTLTQAATVDGTTQPGSACNNIKTGTAHVLNIVVDLNGNGGWTIASTATIKGIKFTGGSGSVLQVDTGANATVLCTVEDGNGAGFANVSASSGSLTIGGASVGDGNVIINSTIDGIDVIDSTGTFVIEGNLVGIQPDGTAAGNEDGIYVSNTGTSATITGNVSSGNRHYGLHVDNSATTTSSGNKIGTNLDGTSAVPNNTGVKVHRGAIITADSELISGNTIEGLHIDADAGSGNAITNSIIGYAADGTTPLCNGTPQVNDLGTGTNLTGTVIDTACDTPPTPLPGCCAIINIDGVTCVDQNLFPISSVADCEAVLPSPGPGTPTPAAIYNPALYCAPTPGDVAGMCFTPAAGDTPTPTPTSSTPVATATGTATNTPTITNTPTVTPTVTPTATPSCQPQRDRRGEPDLVLCNQACDSPPCDGAYVPADQEPFGRVKVFTCQNASGTASAIPVCYAHTGYYQGTPIPLDTPIACPGKYAFKDTFEQCTGRITACEGCKVTGWVDRLPNAEADVQP